MTDLGVLLAAGGGGGGGGALLFLLALYVVPSVVAVVRKMPNVGTVVVINLLLGWTVIGWIVALGMALGSSAPRGVTISNVINNSVGGSSDGAQAGSLPSSPDTDGAASRPVGMWSTDPYENAKLRYHDGERWTDHVADEGGGRRSSPAEFTAPEAGKGWHSDPFGRFVHRFFDGDAWTSSVSDETGATGEDSASFAAPRKPAPRVDPPPTTTVPPPPVS